MQRVVQATVGSARLRKWSNQENCEGCGVVGTNLTVLENKGVEGQRRLGGRMGVWEMENDERRVLMAGSADIGRQRERGQSS